MTDSDRNHNLRQFRLMQRLLEQYQAGAIKLRQLIDDLEALNAALRNPTEDWLSEFEPAWGALEDVYAAMLAEGRTSLNEDVDKPLIKRSGISLALQHPVSSGCGIISLPDSQCAG